MENLYGYGKRIMGKAKKPKKKDPSEKVPTFYQIGTKPSDKKKKTSSSPRR